MSKAYWLDKLNGMPRLTAEQRAVIQEIIDRHLGWIAIHYPNLDDAIYNLQNDLDSLTKERNR